MSQDDFYIQGSESSKKIIIDLLIIPVDQNGEKIPEFSEDWETLFTTNRIRNDEFGNAFVPLRSINTFDPIKNSYKTQQTILQAWPDYVSEDKTAWFQSENGKDNSFRFEEIPFFYMDAQRDILEDIKLKSSYLEKCFPRLNTQKQR